MFIKGVSAVHNSLNKTFDGKIIWLVCVEEEDGEESFEMTIDTMRKMRNLLSKHIEMIDRKEMEKRVQSQEQKDEDNDRSLEGWCDLILGNK